MKTAPQRTTSRPPPAIAWQGDSHDARVDSLFPVNTDPRDEQTRRVWFTELGGDVRKFSLSENSSVQVIEADEDVSVALSADPSQAAEPTKADVACEASCASANCPRIGDSGDLRGAVSGDDGNHGTRKHEEAGAADDHTVDIDLSPPDPQVHNESVTMVMFSAGLLAVIFLLYNFMTYQLMKHLELSFSKATLVTASTFLGAMGLPLAWLFGLFSVFKLNPPPPMGLGYELLQSCWWSTAICAMCVLPAQLYAYDAYRSYSEFTISCATELSSGTSMAVVACWSRVSGVDEPKFVDVDKAALTLEQGFAGYMKALKNFLSVSPVEIAVPLVMIPFQWAIWANDVASSVRINTVNKLVKLRRPIFKRALRRITEMRDFDSFILHLAYLASVPIRLFKHLRCHNQRMTGTSLYVEENIAVLRGHCSNAEKMANDPKKEKDMKNAWQALQKLITQQRQIDNESKERLGFGTEKETFPSPVLRAAFWAAAKVRNDGLSLKDFLSFKDFSHMLLFTRMYVDLWCMLEPFSDGQPEGRIVQGDEDRDLRILQCWGERVSDELPTTTQRRFRTAWEDWLKDPLPSRDDQRDLTFEDFARKLQDSESDLADDFANGDLLKALVAWNDGDNIVDLFERAITNHLVSFIFEVTRLREWTNELDVGLFCCSSMDACLKEYLWPCMSKYVWSTEGGRVRAFCWYTIWTFVIAFIGPLHRVLICGLPMYPHPVNSALVWASIASFVSCAAIFIHFDGCLFLLRTAHCALSTLREYTTTPEKFLEHGYKRIPRQERTASVEAGRTTVREGELDENGSLSNQFLKKELKDCPEAVKNVLKNPFDLHLPLDARSKDDVPWQIQQKKILMWRKTSDFLRLVVSAPRTTAVVFIGLGVCGIALALVAMLAQALFGEGAVQVSKTDLHTALIAAEASAKQSMISGAVAAANIAIQKTSMSSGGDLFFANESDATLANDIATPLGKTVSLVLTKVTITDWIAGFFGCLMFAFVTQMIWRVANINEEFNMQSVMLDALGQDIQSNTIKDDNLRLRVENYAETVASTSKAVRMSAEAFPMRIFGVAVTKPLLYSYLLSGVMVGLSSSREAVQEMVVDFCNSGTGRPSAFLDESKMVSELGVSVNNTVLYNLICGQLSDMIGMTGASLGGWTNRTTSSASTLSVGSENVTAQKHGAARQLRQLQQRRRTNVEEESKL